MSSPGLPKALTRGYGTAFRTMISEAAARALTIKDLEALDSEECYREIARSELQNRIESGHGTP